MVTAPARRGLVRWMQTKGLSQRRGLQIMRMSPSALRYEPRPDRNQEVRERILALAQRHRRYGVGMIHLKLRQAGGARRYPCRIVSHYFARGKRTRSGRWISSSTASHRAGR
jgi:hypothetical protein